MTIVGRAVPWSLQIENREKARERTNFPVCLHLTLKLMGTSSKGLMVTSMEQEVLSVPPFPQGGMGL